MKLELRYGASLLYITVSLEGAFGTRSLYSEVMAIRDCPSGLDFIKLLVYLKTMYTERNVGYWVYSEDLTRDFKNMSYEEMWKESNPEYLSATDIPFLPRRELIELYHERVYGKESGIPDITTR